MTTNDPYLSSLDPSSHGACATVVSIICRFLSKSSIMSSSCWAHGLRLEAETTARGALTCLLTEGFVQFGLSLLFAIFFNKAINTKLLPAFDNRCNGYCTYTAIALYVLSLSPSGFNFIDHH